MLRPQRVRRRLELGSVFAGSDVESGEPPPATTGYEWVWLVIAPLSTGILYVVAFPPFNLPEASYVFAVPLLLWSYNRPAPRVYIGLTLLAGWVSWCILLWWLRHVTLVGTVILSGYLGLYFTAWFALVRWALPQIDRRAFGVRLAVLAGLAGGWVILEHLRGVLFTGFPWLPLAASQWERSTVLQISAYTGAAGVTFVLVFFNLGLTCYVRRFLHRRAGSHWYERICGEFYVALLLLLASASGLIWTGAFGLQRQELFTGVVVQPYIRQDLKWAPEELQRNLRTVEQQTVFANLNAEVFGGDLVFWPESVTPLVVKGDAEGRVWHERVAREIGKPIMMGSMVVEDESYYNVVCLVTPESGLVEPYYAKRRLVPFGEYVPRWIPFMTKFVPLEDTFFPGRLPQAIPLQLSDQSFRVGALVCYEDAFASLCRDTVRENVDFLFVATNNAWYGEEGGAYQHAAHSVLRAVETRRPVVRCGNGGWSGWIDEYGNVREVLERPGQGIYFRGSDLISVSRDRRWARRQSFYVRFGDWFVSLCGALILGAYFALRFSRDGGAVSGDALRRICA